MEPTLREHSSDSRLPRATLCRLVFACIFVFLVYYFFSNTLVHQLQSPVIKFPYVDLTYWLFHLLQIPEYFTGNYLLAYGLDLMLFSSCIMSFIFPSRRLFIMVFFCCYVVYYFVYNSFGTQHTHAKVGIMLISIPFMFKDGPYFKYLWEAMRYFTLFIYADAFLWKISRGYFLLMDHGQLLIKRNYAAYQFYHPFSPTSQLIRWTLNHPLLIYMLFLAGLVLEGLFLVGFFTKRFDRYLFIFSMLLPAGFLFLSDAFFFELLVLSFTLIHFDSSRKLHPALTND